MSLYLRAGVCHVSARLSRYAPLIVMLVSVAQERGTYKGVNKDLWLMVRLHSLSSFVLYSAIEVCHCALMPILASSVGS